MNAVIYTKRNAYLSGGGTQSLNTGKQIKCGLLSDAEQAWTLSAESHSGHLKGERKPALHAFILMLFASSQPPFIMGA